MFNSNNAYKLEKRINIMARAITIYLDDESSDLLDKLKEKEPKFNISQFVQNSIKNVNPRLDEPERIKLEWETLEVDLINVKNKIDFLKEQERKLRVEQEAKEQTKREEEIRMLRKREILLVGYKNSLKNFLDVSENKINEIAEEYNNSNKQDSLLEFAQLKGYKLK